MKWAKPHHFTVSGFFDTPDAIAHELPNLVGKRVQFSGDLPGLAGQEGTVKGATVDVGPDGLASLILTVLTDDLRDVEVVL